MEKLDFLITSNYGSKSFSVRHNLANEDDYFSFVNSKNLNDLSENTPLCIQHQEKKVYCLPITAISDIKTCASWFSVLAYDSIDSYESKLLYDFWCSNKEDLSNIYPHITYGSIISKVQRCIDFQDDSAIEGCMRLMSMLQARYYVDNFLDAKNNINYFLPKNCNNDFVDVKKNFKELNTETFLRFFKNQPINYTLHDEYKKVVDGILKGE